ncbi:MAG: (2Fe-2S) ferredoxin domain-containing protein [Betaproteobacteria bacterium]
MNSPDASVARETAAPQPSQPYYRHRVFFCLNERSNGQDACGHHGAQQAFERCKMLIKSAGLAGPGGVRINKAGCLDRCAAGPMVVVYPQGTWYSYVDLNDIEDIVESHLKKGQVVERLLTPPHLGR